DDEGGAESAVMVGAGACDVVVNGSQLLFVYGNLHQGFPVFAGPHDLGIIQQWNDMVFHDNPGGIKSTVQVRGSDQGFECVGQDGVFVPPVGSDFAFA